MDSHFSYSEHSRERFNQGIDAKERDIFLQSNKENMTQKNSDRHDGSLQEELDMKQDQRISLSEIRKSVPEEGIQFTSWEQGSGSPALAPTTARHWDRKFGKAT